MTHLKSPRSPRARDESVPDVSQAQRDANTQIAATQSQVEDARNIADSQIEQIHTYFDQKSEEDYARQEAEYEKQRLKGYERLRDLKREQDAELGRTRRDGERDLTKVNTYYTDATYASQRAGEERLEETKKQEARELEYAKLISNDNVTEEQGKFRQQYEDLHKANEEALAKLTDDTQQRYEELKTQSSDATEKAHDSFQEKYNNRVKDDAQVLQNLDARANAGILEVRRDTEQKLAAYASRQSDPFYKMLDMDVHFSDEGDAFVLTATIPEHEQKHISVSVKGSQVVLTGVRRNEEKLEIEPGRTQGTNSYQSFLETFPIAWPVDMNKMTRRFEGEQLIVRIPKKNDYAYHSQQESRIPVERLTLERPHFPENLPHVNQEIAPADPAVSARERMSSRPRKGSGPLT